MKPAGRVRGCKGMERGIRGHEQAGQCVGQHGNIWGRRKEKAPRWK